ncbi:hypothetical protein L0F81_33260 [Streptomyces tricolor]|uniref:Uncharacterized protein n=1 Tax=Streptomyces tricolor TaxID=68277 RepID=A0ABS9JRC1_9ACTN|nr:hypothetical protein [Streptomyces tricolor]MCG0068078.1 hypothetical protein [Streptomyces tricolor]
MCGAPLRLGLTTEPPETGTGSPGPNGEHHGRPARPRPRVIESRPVVCGKGMPVSAAGPGIRDVTCESVRSFGNGEPARTYGRER